MHVLGHDASWRLKHACPACMYKLEGEDELIFSMLTMMDGNDSLKQVLRWEKMTMAQDEADNPTLAKSRERKVDKWAKSRLGEQLSMEVGNTQEDNPCADRWKNMINDVTSEMWGIFDETGVFLALCRHGFVILLVDMIPSDLLSGKFLTSNYYQALSIIKTEATLKVWMLAEGVEDYAQFHRCLDKEKVYLIGLKDVPKTNIKTLEMEYVQKLVNLSVSQAKHAIVTMEARHARADEALYEPAVTHGNLAQTAFARPTGIPSLSVFAVAALWHLSLTSLIIGSFRQRGAAKKAVLIAGIFER
ncbi:hypothetical protein DFH09DRAFT_1343352 [Mycena vulgaris]|nr:hypothetical protein DFH09DRAFT_1343352 [Mycena vulgaris]